MAIPALMRRLEDASDNFYLWTALGNIGMTPDLDIFKSILSFLLLYIGKSPKVGKIAVLLARMPSRPIPLLTMYLEKVLILFHEKAAMMHKTNDVINITPSLLQLCNLVRVLLENEGLMEQVSQNQETCHQLRNMWFYLVLFILGSNGNWPKEWVPVLKGLAKHVPPLMLDRQSRNLDVSLASDSILVATFNDGVCFLVSDLFNVWIFRLRPRLNRYLFHVFLNVPMKFDLFLGLLLFTS